MMTAERLHGVLSGVVLGNSGAAYLEALLTFLGTYLGLRLFKRLVLARLTTLVRRSRTRLDDLCLECLRQIGPFVYGVLAFYLATRSLILPAGLARLIAILFVLTSTVTVVRFLQQLVVFMLTQASVKTAPDDRMRPVALKNLAFVVQVGLWVAATVFMLDNLGIQVTGLVAGLGIGGIAVALAAQAVLGDAFSAFAIFMDRPFEVGDFIIVGDLRGEVEQIGFKTTRLRSLDGEQLVLANSDLTGSRIRNYKRMKERRVTFTIGVVYQTPVEALRRIPSLVRGIVEGVPTTRFDRAHFCGFGESSLTIEVVYFVLSADYNQYMDAQQAINLQVLEVFTREGIEFAYPTQTVYSASAREGDGRGPVG